MYFISILLILRVFLRNLYLNLVDVSQFQFKSDQDFKLAKQKRHNYWEAYVHVLMTVSHLNLNIT